MKAVKEKLSNESVHDEDPEKKEQRIKDFEKKAAAYAKKIVANFKDFEFVRIFAHLF